MAFDDIIVSGVWTDGTTEREAATLAEIAVEEICVVDCPDEPGVGLSVHIRNR
jgi:hypothetical protein